MKTKDFWYDLPEELIAQTPLQQRDSSRLLALDRVTGQTAHKHFYDIIDYLQPGDCLVMNDSRVLPARLLGHRPTGGAVEVLLLRDLGDNRWECLVKPGRKMQVGHEAVFGDGQLRCTVREVREDGNRVVEFHYEGIFLEVLESLGKMPLPP
jgi:S-adenosylmethionine:tRNA ribosyltransferase-isomerase